jgi:probable phosphoglycerate mutase
MGAISWGGPGIPADGRPWTLDYRMLQEGFGFNAVDWRRHPYFAENTVTRYYSTVTDKFDEFLREKGYRHEGRRFLCRGGGDETLALFSHGGSAGFLMAHLLALPYPYVASVLPYDFASITTISFPVTEGEWVFPRVELFNDCGHIRRDIDYLTEAGQAKTYGSIGRKPNIKALEELQNRKPYSAIPILTDESDQRILVGRE